MLSLYCISGTFLGIGDRTANKTDKNFHRIYILDEAKEQVLKICPQSPSKQGIHESTVLTPGDRVIPSELIHCT